MPSALFESKNLIGDALYIQPALEAWAKAHPNWDIDLLTLDDHVTCLYRGMGIRKLNLVFQRPEKGYQFEHRFDVNAAFKLGEQGKHIAEAYAQLLGVPIASKLPKYFPSEGPAEEGLILLSIFSNSCASRQRKPANKMISWTHWSYILAILRQYGKIAVLGSAKDRAPLAIDESEYITGLSLEHVARILQKAKLLVSIDNGLAHLAATQGTPTILAYPTCLGLHWIIPPSPKVTFVQMNPVTFPVQDAIRMVREGIKRTALLEE